MRWWEDAQTKHMRTCPWCGDDVYVLGWGVLTPQAMVQATPPVVLDTNSLGIIESMTPRKNVFSALPDLIFFTILDPK